MNTITAPRSTHTPQTELWCKKRKSFTLMLEKSDSGRGAAGSVDRGRVLRKTREKGVGEKPGQCGVVRVKENKEGQRNRVV